MKKQKGIVVISVLGLLWALPATCKDSLEARVQRLEKAVEELQKNSSKDSAANSAPPAKPEISHDKAGVSCTLATPFDGAFTETERTEELARAAALAKCARQTKGSIYCEAKRVNCGK